MAAPRARQQDLGGQDAFVANPSIIQSIGCIVAIGDNHIGRSDTALSPILSASGWKDRHARLPFCFYDALRFGMVYRDSGAAIYDERHRCRVLTNLQRRTWSLGYQLEVMPAEGSVS
jgi:hypothetical protein